MSQTPDYQIRVTRLSVLQKGEPLFSEKCSHVSIVDEAAGEFVEVKQQSGHSDADAQTIQISPEEWPSLKEAIQRLISECQDPCKPTP